jgi:hypothetical protein
MAATYPGYDRADEQPFLFFGVSDGRIAPKERVVTLGEQAGEAISFPYTELRTSGIAEVDRGSTSRGLLGPRHRLGA